MVGETLANRYLVQRALGEGAMGQVWLVEDTTTGATLALKIVAGKLAHAERSLLEFIQEFRLMTQLRHQNCCEVADYGLLPDGVPYMTMEVVPGQGLDELLELSRTQPGPGEAGSARQIGLDLERFEPVLTQLLHALAYIHARGYVHCDLKAANVRVRPDGVVKLMDFGLMEYAGRTDGPIKGTLAYMAPEMIKRGVIDRRADLYSLGCLAYEMLTGSVPFPAERPGDILRAHLGLAPAAPSTLRAGIEPRFEALVLKLLAKEPIDRFQSADEVLAALGQAAVGVGGTALLASPLMGRAQEMGKLFVQLARVVTTKPGAVVWAWGPAGIGKSRLLLEFGFNVQLENLPVGSGAAHEFAQTPYGPFVAALRGLLPALKEAVPDALQRHAPVLAKLLPELLEADAHVSSLESASGERLRLQRTVAELLGALARRRGAVIVLEDWQWADPLSFELLDYVSRSNADAPLLFVIASRHAPDGLPFPVIALPLTPLSETGVRRMIASMLGSQEPPEGVVQLVASAGAGNPYRVEVMLEHLVTTDKLARKEGQWTTEAALVAADLPTDLRALLAQKITALSPDAQRLARVAAVFAKSFALEAAQEVLGTAQEELFQALGELVQAQILAQDEDGRYRFTQSQVQELVYLGLAEADKLQLHGAVAASLEGACGDLSPVELPLEALTAIADQYLGGDVPAKTVAYALEAGLRHLDLFANGPAETYLAAGLACLDPDDPPQQAMRFGYLRGLGEVLARTGRVEVARERYGEAIELAEELDDPFLISRLLAAQARINQGLDELELSLQQGQRAHEMALVAGDTVGAVRCQILNARTWQYMGRETEAVAELQAALALARTAQDKACLGEALANIGYMLVATDSARLGEGMAYLNEAVTLLSEVGDRQGVLSARAMVGQARAKLGDYGEAATAFGEALALAREVGNHPEIVGALIGLATSALEQGDFLEAVDRAREGADEAMTAQSNWQMATCLAIEAYAQGHLGRLVEAQALIRVAADMAGELSHKNMEVRIQLYRAETLVLLGELEEAAVASERLQRLMRETGDMEPQARLYALLGEICARQGDMEGANEYLRAGLAIASLGLVRGTEARVLEAMAWHATRSGAWDVARDRATAALAMAVDLGLAYLEAKLRLLLGEIALATSAPDAGEHFDAAAELAATRGYLLLAMPADFGRAAARPYAPEARALAEGARDALLKLAEVLDAEPQQRFLALPERQRVLVANYIDFSLPIADKPTRRPVRPELWNTM